MSLDLYSNFGQTIKKVNPQALEEKRETNSSLIELFQSKEIYSSSYERIVLSFCEELKKILEIKSVKDISVRVFELDHTLSVLYSEWSDELVSKDELPHLTNLYMTLSPLFLQTVLENSENENAVDGVYKGWLEAIRISLEEEIYIWQEKIA